MVYYKKQSWLSKAVDGITLTASGLIGGYAVFGVEWLREKFTWVSDVITSQLLPNSLSTYDFSASLSDAWGLGILPLACAMGVSLYYKDDDILDNPTQMGIGMLIGLLLTGGLIMVGVSPSLIQNIGAVFGVILIALYALVRSN